MYTAKNYAAQAERDLNSDPKAKLAYSSVINTIECSQHFALPDEGRILDDDLKGLSGAITYLPYDKMTIEYYSKNIAETKGLSKHLVVVQGLKDGFNANWLYHIDKINKWDICPIGINIKHQTVDKVFDLQYSTFNLSEHKFNDKQVEAGALLMIDAIFELLEALSCRNVYTETLEPVDEKKNEKRKKKGKLPLYETKILVVETASKEIDKAWKGGTHASPRQHLRRGHIRRYSWGNIWINNTIVGKKGFIEKSYEVR